MGLTKDVRPQGARYGTTENIKKQREKYPDIATRVIDISDIILEILDARFIDDTRNLKVEESIKTKGKKLLYVLNKADLVERNKVKDVIKKEKLYPHVFVSCRTKKGIRELRDKIKAMSGGLELEGKERAQVGIIGYPNTGKSSLINLLTGKFTSQVSPISGFTKGMQKRKLKKGIIIIDTPGVIPDKEYSNIDIEKLARHAKIGAMSYDRVKDPEMAVTLLMENYSKQIEKYYEINAEGNPDVLIEELGKKKHFLVKGGEVDIDRTTRIILRDWQEGRIRA